MFMLLSYEFERNNGIPMRILDFLLGRRSKHWSKSICQISRHYSGKSNMEWASYHTFDSETLSLNGRALARLAHTLRSILLVIWVPTSVIIRYLRPSYYKILVWRCVS
jgi:hypothetical protein